MKNAYTDRFNSLLHCAVIAVAFSVPACTAHDDPSFEPVGTQALPEVFPKTECVLHTAGEGWKNGFIPQQTGRFITTIELAPMDANIDAVVGLSNGRADAFTDLAAIVRLNPAGFIDVRNGSTYMADMQYPYVAGRRYGFRVQVDLPNRLYDVFVYPGDDDDSRLPLARGYRFRTEQSTVTRLDNAARILATGTGSFEACRFSTGLSSGSCRRSLPGSWLSEPFPAQSGRFQVHYLARAMQPNMDIVFGLSNGAPTAFSRLAAIVRFNAQGMLDVRDGSVYRADMAIPYGAVENFNVIMDVDVASRTYSVLVSGPYQLGEFVPLATNYRFRTEQASVTSLNYFGQYVDATGAPGEGHACFLVIDYP